MAEISIAKIKIRRGLDSQRKQVILDQGELGYTLDTKRLFVGTGSLEGGHVLGAKVHTPMTVFSALTGLNSERGDIVLSLIHI